MDINKTLIASLLILLSLTFLADCFQMVITDEVQEPQLQEIDCDSACDVRCRLSSRPNLCKRACGTCCARCKCVPPGTYGHYDTCPCYANMTTHGGRHKCP
ncbi:gibberellin-regulated protein 1-like [Tripterygium wilfordii]|uniref:Gibberellin-regulated protein 1-like n=1 Tax=Tripterygium wilfordii TaxID=458696 RepID=A0A7J7D3C8_TRIWF|nr:gibberellin-regulated protein 1-like [Tripterygium wilfordii]KAF5740857.1 gibberellin-regulated protein 1-like [Tripterygium wilfordii]